MFIGTLQNNFQNWSWGTVNLQDKTVVRSGSSYSVSLVVKNYEALYLEGNFALPANNLDDFQFWVNGGSTGGQSVNLIFLSNNKPLAGSSVSVSQLIGGPIPTNQWVQVSVKFSSLNLNSTSLDGFFLQAGVSDNQGPVYFDDIQFTIPLPSAEPVTVVAQGGNGIPVSPYIYGVNFATGDQIERMKYTINRWGGNAATRYSWDIDVQNHANDWYFEDIPNDVPDPSKLPYGSSSDVFVNETLLNGAKVLLTTPMIGWRPFDRTKRCGFSVSKYGAQQSVDPYDTDCGNGVNLQGKDITGNDPHDTSIETDPSYNIQWVKHLDQAFGNGSVSFFMMDNEPGLWDSTHRDVHPNPLNYDELWQKTSQYAAALKATFPQSTIFGPALWGWCAYMFSPADGCSDGPDRQSHGDLPLLEWYVSQVVQYRNKNNVQLVDVLDIHFYPQATGVTGSPEDPMTAFLRLRSPRGLYDQNYVDQSWINQPIYILKRMNDWLSTYKATNTMKTSVSEFSFGSDDLITATLATTDAIGIFAEQGVYAATKWTAPTSNSKVEDAYSIYLNYDGKGSKISGNVVPSNVSNIDLVSSHIYNDPSNRKIFVILLNKCQTASSLSITVDVSAFTNSGSVQYFSYDPNNRLRPTATSSVSQGKFVYQSLAWSGTLAVVSY